MKKITIILLILVTMFTLTGCDKTDKNTDAYKFKEEYEKVNGQKSKSGKTIRTLKIAEDNPFIYSDCKEIVEMIENKESFIVYFGFNDCPWCRSIIEELIKASKNKKVDKIYYVDVKEIRDVKEFDEDGNIVTTKDGDESYMKLIELLDNVLADYELTKDSEKVSANEKRIYAPNVVAISNGKAIQLETGISDELTDPYGELTDKVKKYAYNKFKCLIKCLEEASITCQKDMC